MERYAGARLLPWSCDPYSSGAECKATIAVLPVASVENHGVLPLATDVMIAECVVKRAKGLVADISGVSFLPIIPYSVSVEHKPPRLGVRPSVFIEYLTDLLGEILAYARAAIVAVFHGGAFHAAYTAARYARRAFGGLVAVYNFWQAIEEALQRLYGVQPGVIHADPVEASILAACGYGGFWVREEDTTTILSTLHTQAGKASLQPWIAEDLPGFYPEQSVPVSRELGEKLLEKAVERLASTIRATARLLQL